ncbi:MATE family efflux transporter [Pandoraea apista]|uniref:MATE family efflux transporter n=1 Tax=Pandoraea apista TaxID=93218 RepID=UPI00248DD6A1|nr:MATE family efflux transporter [Pandoraea apista]
MAGHDLTRGPIGKTLFWFSLPVLGSNVLQSLNASINAMWIGHYLGESALTAASNANILLFFLLGVVFGISMANTILIGQSIGAKNQELTRRIVGTSASFFILASTAVAVFGYLFTPELLGALGTPGDARAFAVAYLRIIFVALPVMYFYNFVMMALRGAGDARTPFRFMLLSAGLDVALNPLLIFGWGPLPPFGIAGSAGATLIAQTVSLAALMYTLYRRRDPLWLRRKDWKYLRIDPELLRLLVVKGLPMGLQMVVISSSAMVMMGFVNGYGSQTTAAYGVASQLWTYVQMPALAIGAGVSALTAQNVGAGLWNRVSRIGRVGVGLNFVMTGSLVVAILLFNRQFMNAFLPEDGYAIAVAQHINAVVAWSFVLFGVTIVLFGVVRATGAVTAPLVILFVSQWVIRLPFAWQMRKTWGAEAIWWSFPLGFAVSLIMALAYYRWGHWRGVRMLPRGDPPVVTPLGDGVNATAGAPPAPMSPISVPPAVQAERAPEDGCR